MSHYIRHQEVMEELAGNKGKLQEDIKKTGDFLFINLYKMEIMPEDGSPILFCCLTVYLNSFQKDYATENMYTLNVMN